MGVENLPKMNKVEMVRCEVTGKLYPATECEVVVIKIVKYKGADINGYNPFGMTKSVARVEETIAVDTGKPVIANHPALDPASPEYNKIVHRKQSVIPASMKDIFTKPPDLMT